MKHITKEAAAALRKAGVTAEQLEKARKALKPGPKLKLSRKSAKRIAMILNAGGTAVVTRKRVFTLETFNIRIKGAHKMVAKMRQRRASKTQQGLLREQVEKTKAAGALAHG